MARPPAPTSVFGVIVGTGTGGAIVINQRLCSGPNAIAGEWGHNMLPWPRDDEWPGPPCYCGRTACIETFLSGPGLERDYASACGPCRASARDRARDLPARRAGRRAGRSRARALRASHGARARERDQHPRSARDRPRRRHVEREAPLSRTSRACGASSSSPIASTRASCRPSTATRAASAAPPGSGSTAAWSGVSGGRTRRDVTAASDR